MKKSLLMATAGASAAAILVLAGCSSDGDHAGMPGTDHSTTSVHNMPGMDHGESPSAPASGTPASGPHNDADVAFATGMIPHHEQAIDMADMALDKVSNSKLLALATNIKAAQGPEITQMSGWLVGWGQPVRTGSMSHDMPGMDDSGMMSSAEMSQLEATSGAAFDRLWVQLMIKHHQGAVQMAETELASGQNLDAQALAQSIVTTQSAEIAELNALLAQL